MINSDFTKREAEYLKKINELKSNSQNLENKLSEKEITMDIDII
jgi:hypothetical protein